MSELKIKKFDNHEIIFNDGSGNWVMKITKQGIIFNKENFIFANTNDFAKAVCEILEKNFAVKFTEKFKTNVPEGKGDF